MDHTSMATTRRKLLPCVVLPMHYYGRLPVPDLPVSELNADDFPQGPNGMAALCEARIDELEGWKRIVPRHERRPINQHIHTLKGMVAWCKSRSGYVSR